MEIAHSESRCAGQLLFSILCKTVSPALQTGTPVHLADRQAYRDAVTAVSLQRASSSPAEFLAELRDFSFVISGAGFSGRDARTDHRSLFAGKVAFASLPAFGLEKNMQSRTPV